MVVSSPVTYCLCLCVCVCVCVAPLTLFPLTQMNVEKLKKMAGAVRTGGKGSMRRCLLLFLSSAVVVIGAFTFHLANRRLLDLSLHIKVSCVNGRMAALYSSS
jgi:hypothetical protein